MSDKQLNIFLCSPKVQGQGQKGNSGAGWELDAFFFPTAEGSIHPAVWEAGNLT